MQMKTFLGWAWATGLWLFYSLLLTAYGTVRLSSKLDGFLLTPLLVGIVVPLLLAFLGASLLTARICRKKALDPSGSRRGMVLFLLTLPAVYLMLDAPPIEHDYTLQDVVSTDPRVLESYDTLMLFRRDGALNVGTNMTAELYRQALTNPVAHAESVDRAWADLAAGRSLIESLDTYPGIADITPSVKLAMSLPVISFTKLRVVSMTYQTYALLKTAEGHPEEGARQLAKLQSVARKALPHAATLTGKMIWLAIAKGNMNTAYAILQHPQCTPQTVGLLGEAFTPIPAEDTAMRRPLTADYVYMNHLLREEVKPSGFFDVFALPGSGSTAFRKASSLVVYYGAFRKNRTSRALRQTFDPLIEGSGRAPPSISSRISFWKDYIKRPDIRNLGGWCFVAMAVPEFSKCCADAFNTTILSDLLAAEIERSAGRSKAHNDGYSDAPFLQDEQTGRLFSVGPDRAPHTADDIVLGKP